MTTPVPASWARLDPAALLVARAIAQELRTPLRELGVEAARAMLASPPADRPLTPLDRVDEVIVPARGRALHARRYYAPVAQDDRKRSALLYLHGGGFILGTLNGVDEVCRAIAARSGWDVFSLEYRLAPEDPYPAALHDALDALDWMRKSAHALGIDADRVAVGGDSAGANLAAALCLHLRDNGLALPVAQALVYPPVDDRFSTPSWTEFADAPLLTAADARWCWEQYVGADPKGVDPYAAPLKAKSLRELPPALVLTAEVDVLRDDGEAYAERLRGAGVPTTCIRYAGVFHGFFAAVGALKQADEAINEVVRHLHDVGR